APKRNLPYGVSSQNMRVIVAGAAAVVTRWSKRRRCRPDAVASAIGYILRIRVGEHEGEALGESPFHLQLPGVVVIAAGVFIQIDAAKHRIGLGRLEVCVQARRYIVERI